MIDYNPSIELKVVNPKVREYGLPEFGTEGAAAIDLRAMIDTPINLYPGERLLIPTGIAMWIKSPYLVGLMYPRSGLGHKKGLILGNGTGVIDSDYQGELNVSAWNRNQRSRHHAPTPIIIHPGERIAQLVISPIVRPTFNEVEEFSNQSERGEGGFGSTGTV